MMALNLSRFTIIELVWNQSIAKFDFNVNPINPGLLALELTLGGGVFHPPSITPLSLRLDCSNFAQSYFQIG